MPFGFVPPPTPPASGATPPFSGGDVVGGYLVDNNTEIRDNADPSKLLRFELSGTTGTVVLTPPSTAGTYALATGSSWNPTAAEVITNKDLSDPTNDITGATATSLTNGSGATISLPTGVGARTLATISGNEVLTNKGLTSPAITGIVGVSTAAGATITFPLGAGDRTLSSLTGTETLENKTLTAPVIASITNVVSQTVPSTTAGTLVNTTQAQTFTSGVKTFNDGFLALRNPADSFSATLRAGAQTGARSFTLPVVGGDDTFVTLAATQTLANKTLSTPVVTGLVSFTNGSGATITTPAGAGDRSLATLDGTETLSNKTLSAPVIGTIVSGVATQSVPTDVDGELLNTTQDQMIASGVKTFQDGTLALEGFGTGNAFLLGGNQSVNTNFTLPSPGADDTLVSRVATQTLTNKTLTTPVIASITSGAVAQAVPSGTAGTLVNTTQAQTFITGVKTFNDGFLALRNPADSFSATLRAGAQTLNIDATLPVLAASDTFVMLGATQQYTAGVKTYNTGLLQLRNPLNSFSVTLNAGAQTAARTFTFPVASTGTIVIDNATQTLTGKTLTAPTITAPTISGAALIADSSFFRDDLDNTKRMAFQLSGLPTATTVTYTTPNANGALVIDTATQTLTNKTLTTPVIASITSGAVAQTVPSVAAGELVNTTQAQTFTTGVKTFNDGFLALRNPADTFSATLRAGAQTSARSFTLPVSSADDVLVTLTATQALLNKTLTSPVITTIVNVVSQTVPSGTAGELVNTTQAQTVDNKSFTDSTTSFVDNVDPTKIARLQCSQISALTTRTYTLPNVSSTLLTTDDVSTGATSIGATTPYSSLYLEDLLNVTRTDALSTTYRNYCEFFNPNDTSSWVLSVQTQAVNFSRLGFRYNNGATTSRGYFSNVGPDTQVNHTMQHHFLVEDPATLTTGVGLLFQRVDGSVATFTSRELETIKTGPLGIIVDDALPVMRLCPASRNAKGVYGVLCRPAPREWFGAAVGYELDDVPDIDERGLFATQGEGALWVLAPVVGGVVPSCYHIELGDFLSSGGFVAGYAGRQMSQADATIDDADAHYSWSVARAGFSCDYDLAATAYTCENVTLGGVVYRRAFIPVGFGM